MNSLQDRLLRNFYLRSQSSLRTFSLFVPLGLKCRRIAEYCCTQAGERFFVTRLQVQHTKPTIDLLSLGCLVRRSPSFGYPTEDDLDVGKLRNGKRRRLKLDVYSQSYAIGASPFLIVGGGPRGKNGFRFPSLF